MVIIWDPRTGNMVHRLEGHKQYVTCCAFSDDNQLLATGSNDRTIIIWHLNKIVGKEISIQYDNSNKTDFDVSNESDEELSKKQSKLTELDDETKNELFNKKFPTEWNCDDVCLWLSSIGLDQYVNTFKSNEIDGIELLHLTNDALLMNLKIGILYCYHVVTFVFN